MFLTLLASVMFQDPDIPTLYASEIDGPVEKGTVVVMQITSDPVDATVEYTRTKVENGATKSGDVTGRLEIGDLIDGTDTYDSRWTTVSIGVGDTVFDANDPEAESYLVGVPIEFVSDGVGSPVNIIKSDELIDGVIENFGGDLDSDGTEALRAFLAGMTDEGLAGHLLKPSAMVALCQGTQLTYKVPVRNEVETEAAFGDAMLPATVTWHLKSIDAVERTADISLVNEYDQKAMVDFVIEVLQEMSPETKFTKAEMRDIRKMKNRTEAECVMDLDTGLTRSVLWKRAVEFPGQSTIETYDIKVAY